MNRQQIPTLTRRPAEERWPDGREAVVAFARELAANPGGYALMEHQLKAQQRMQMGQPPQAHAVDVLVAVGLANTESGYAFATPALHAALALFDGGGE